MTPTNDDTLLIIPTIGGIRLARGNNIVSKKMTSSEMYTLAQRVLEYANETFRQEQRNQVVKKPVPSLLRVMEGESPEEVVNGVD